MTDYTDIFISLYDKVRESQQRSYSVNPNSVRDAMKDIGDLYMPNPKWEMSPYMNNANYNTPEYRVGYLHKYAPCHTGLVYEALMSAFEGNYTLKKFIDSKRQLNICCLGGGPGTDVVAILAAVFENFGFMQCFVTMIDEAKNWSTVFQMIISELRTGRYGSIKQMVSATYFRYEYMDADLLEEIHFNSKVRARIMSADFLTMVKFISAVACRGTRRMVANIFQCMKPGAILLFIDNAGGKFDQMMKTVAKRCNLICIYGPLDHFDYEDTRFSNSKFGFTALSKTKVAIQIWKKEESPLYYQSESLRNEYFSHLNIEAQMADVMERPLQLSNTNRNVRREPEIRNECCSII